MKIAIRGHESRGKEVIQILESLGGKGSLSNFGYNEKMYYWINSNNIILESLINIKTKKEFILYTLEEFEKEFPFKIGDKVFLGKNNEHLYTIKSIKIWFDGNIAYEFAENGLHYAANKLTLYKEMKEERNITLTLEKAKEWYKKGGELKEIALQAFTEEELTKIELPKTWEEYIQQNFHREGYVLTHLGSIAETEITGLRGGENLCPSKQSAEAHLAMIQLEQLRDCWRNGWVPNWSDRSEKWCIALCGNELSVSITTIIPRFLTFPTKEIAKEFLKCFRDLIEKAGDLI